MSLKRIVPAAALAAGLSLGLGAPAGAIVIVGGADAMVGGPHVRTGVEVIFQPCIADGGLNPCIVDGFARVEMDPTNARS